MHEAPRGVPEARHEAPYALVLPPPRRRGDVRGVPPFIGLPRGAKGGVFSLHDTIEKTTGATSVASRGRTHPTRSIARAHELGQHGHLPASAAGSRHR